MRKLIFIWLISITGSGFSQNTDSLLQKAESQTGSNRVLSGSISDDYILPVSSVVYGVLAQDLKFLKRFDRDLNWDILEDHPDFNTHIDDQLQYVPAVGVYALGLMGIKGKNTVVDQTAMYLIANTLTGIAVGTLKTQTRRVRPDGSNDRAFPSGHTAAAFAAAEFMNQEYRDKSPWYGIAGYTIAAATGTLRMLNNKHWLSDVIMGAGVGILTTKLVYITYPFLKSKLLAGKPAKILIVPVYDSGLYGFALTAPLN